MKPRVAVVLAAVVLAASAIWFFALRGSNKSSKSTKPSVSAVPPRVPGPGSGSGGPDRRDRGDDREQQILIDDDPAGALRLEGLVLDTSDAPVAGATVVVSTNPSRTATTEADGSFAFDKLVGRSYTLVARAATGVGGPITAKLTATSDPVVLRLHAAGSVKVTVVEKADRPVAGTGTRRTV
ncbi:MAG TPA: carboxypeptidase-like regulatory domain-containing protein [Verrucomicrobiota bacterium]|nr:carboxypeptidase-like regulatory domain-containing protein [Verrucomicrobiota bacterium]